METSNTESSEIHMYIADKWQSRKKTSNDYNSHNRDDNESDEKIEKRSETQNQTSPERLRKLTKKDDIMKYSSIK